MAFDRAACALHCSVMATTEEMTERERKAAEVLRDLRALPPGHKLTPEELARLNAFIAGETAEIASALPAATPATDLRGFPQRTGEAGEIYSSISGEFRGWSGAGTRLKLDNGQVWEVTDSTARLKVLMNDPQVIIEPGAFGSWYLRVEGYNSRARVKRIK